jgi:hypothetical protein
VSASKGPLNYTTKIPAKQSAAECVDLLGESGAHSVSVTYANREPVGLAFRLDTAGGRRDFTLPVNVEGVQKMLVKANGEGRFRTDGYRVSRYDSREHAANVAWRVVRDWLEAQLAIIAAEMVTLDQVMLPYLEVDGGTLYERYLAASGQLAIGPAAAHSSGGHSEHRASRRPSPSRGLRILPG